MSSQLLINEPPLQVLPTLAQKVGLNEAIILQQIHYWLDPRINKHYFHERYWVRNTYEQWQKQFPFWALNTIRRAVAILEQSGFLITFLTRDFKKHKYYSIDYSKLAQLAIQHSENNLYSPPTQNGQLDLLKFTDRSTQNEQIDQPKMGSSYVGIDSETTKPENTPPPLSPPPQLFARIQEEEEEEEIYFEQENSSWSSGQDQTLPRIDTTIDEEEVMQEQQAQELDLCSELVMLWNQIVQNKLGTGSETSLTNKRKILLNKFLKKVLRNTTKAEKIDAWHNYCTLIAKTKFLMGYNPNGFKVTLDWALVPDNAFKVLEGAYYDKPSLSKGKQDCPSWEEFSEELVRTLPSSKYLTEWVKISIIIAKFIGQEKYKTWFTKVALSEVTETTATFLVEGQFTKDSIIRSFSSEIRCAVQTLYPMVSHIEFNVVPPLGEAA